MLGFWAHEGSFRQAVCQPAIWSSAKGRSTFGALWAARASCGTLSFLCSAIKRRVSLLVYMLLWGVMEWGIGGLVKSSGVGKGTAICRVGWLVRAYVCQAYVSLKTLKAVVYYVSGATLCASTLSRHREKKRPQRRVKANGGDGYGVSIAALA